MFVEIVEKLDVLTSAHWVGISGLTALVAFILGRVSKSGRSKEASAEGQSWPSPRSAPSEEAFPVSAPVSVQSAPVSAPAIARASGLTNQVFLTNKQEAQIDASIRSGRMLNAIKLVRSISGLPLKTSKEYVEARKLKLSA